MKRYSRFEIGGIVSSVCVIIFCGLSIVISPSRLATETPAPSNLELSAELFQSSFAVERNRDSVQDLSSSEAWSKHKERLADYRLRLESLENHRYRIQALVNNLALLSALVGFGFALAQRKSNKKARAEPQR